MSEGRRTNEQFNKRQANMRELIETDGLSTLQFRPVEKTQPMTVADGKPIDNVWKQVVDLGQPEM